MNRHNQNLGRMGEEAAADWYRDSGFDVADQNWRVAQGELDIVATDLAKSLVVFCEVKTRTSDAFGSGAEAVTHKKQQRIRKLSLLWLQASGSRFNEIRFDVAVVDRAGMVEVLEGCF